MMILSIVLLLFPTPMPSPTPSPKCNTVVCNPSHTECEVLICPEPGDE